MSRARSPIEDLRLAIDCLPVHTRRAMRAGIRSSDIIAGRRSAEEERVLRRLEAGLHARRDDPAEPARTKQPIG